MEEEGEHYVDSKCALLILSAHMEYKLSSEKEARKVFSILFLIKSERRQVLDHEDVSTDISSFDWPQNRD